MLKIDLCKKVLRDSNTQLVLGASMLDNRVSLQLNVPLIIRTFKRPDGFEIDRGTVSGLGDVALLANFTLFNFRSGDHSQSPRSGTSDGATAAFSQGDRDFFVLPVQSLKSRDP